MTWVMEYQPYSIQPPCDLSHSTFCFLRNLSAFKLPDGDLVADESFAQLLKLRPVGCEPNAKQPDFG